MLSMNDALVLLAVIWLAFALRDRSVVYKIQEAPLAEYDYIIVGAGTSGCVLASRLSEDTSISVLLIEAGATPSNHSNHDVPMATHSLMTSELVWGDLSVPQTHGCLGMKDKRCSVVHGRGVGGSTSFNNLLYHRGNRLDYDNWAHGGATGWSFDDVLPYFIKSEQNTNAQFLKNGYHGNNGPLVVNDIKVTSLPEAFINAGRELGYSDIDINVGTQSGVMSTQATISAGRRWTVTKAYLEDAMNRNNLHLITEATVNKVLFSGKKAVGVEIAHPEMIQIGARKEIILAAGAIGSPKLLMLSGVGPKQHLQELGIDVVAELPVGENLQDHVTLRGLEYTLKEPVALTQNKMSSIWAWMDLYVFGTGWWSNVMSEGTGFMTTDVSDCPSRPDIQVSMAPLLLGNDQAYLQQEAAIYNHDEQIFQSLHTDSDMKDGFGLHTTLLRPRSRGSVRLSGVNPADPPLIDLNILSDPHDLQTLVQGIRLSEKFGQTEIMSTLLGAKPLNNTHPRCRHAAVGSDAYWECFLRHSAIPEGHLAGTCKMGARGDPTSVVDHELRVQGLENLRVVDASIMPAITASNTYIPTVMIAEKAADLILGKISIVQLNATVS